MTRTHGVARRSHYGALRLTLTACRGYVTNNISAYIYSASCGRLELVTQSSIYIRVIGYEDSTSRSYYPYTCDKEIFLETQLRVYNGGWARDCS